MRQSASNTPTISRLIPSRRHQLSPIALTPVEELSGVLDEVDFWLACFLGLGGRCGSAGMAATGKGNADQKVIHRGEERRLASRAIDQQMRGTMLIFRPHEREPGVIEFVAEPSMAQVERIIEGPRERVPGFFSIEHVGTVRRCTAFGTFGKKKSDRPLNVAATIEWDKALRRDMGIGLIRRDGTRADQLAGPVVVLFGG